MPTLGLPGAFERAQQRLDEIEHQLRSAGTAYGLRVSGEAVKEEDFSYGFDRGDFVAAVEKCREYILAGDIFQVVLSQRMSVPFQARPLDVYRSLRALNPSPYMYFIDLGETQIVGSSPEVLVRVQNRRVTLRPIAGTRKRGKTAAEDQALAEELMNDPKECAEHLMLIDLGRNDVGRVAQTGSVEMTDQMIIERYSHVMHIVSEVQGDLDKDSVRHGCHTRVFSSRYPFGCAEIPGDGNYQRIRTGQTEYLCGCRGLYQLAR